MKEEAIQNNVGNKVKTRRSAMVKAFILVVFVASAVYAVRFTPLKDYLTLEALGHFLDAAGLWAPLVFVLFYAGGVCLFVPGTLLTGLGAAIFGAYWGFLYVWVGAMAGSSAAFFIAHFGKRLCCIPCWR